MFKWLQTIYYAIIPTLLFFDMTDPVLLVVICSLCFLELVVNVLAVFLLGSASVTKNVEIKHVIRERMTQEIEDDKSYYYRTSLIVLMQCFTIYLVLPLHVVAGVMFTTLVGLLISNMILSNRVISDSDE